MSSCRKCSADCWAYGVVTVCDRCLDIYAPPGLELFDSGKTMIAQAHALRDLLRVERGNLICAPSTETNAATELSL